MRLPWDRRGTVAYGQMPDMKPETIRRLSDADLFQLLAGHVSTSAPHIAGQAELRRRENATARWALGVSFLSLIVATVAVVLGVD